MAILAGRRVGLVLAVTAFAGLFAAPAAARPKTPTLSKFESRTLPSKAVTRRIGEQLGELLVPPAQRMAPGAPTRPLQDLTFRTRPRATYVPGVCQADVAVFEFHPVGRATRPGDVPTRLVGITAETGYRLLRPAGVALAAFEKADDEDRLPESPLDFPDTAACERLAAEEAVFTRADSPADFLENMALLEKIGTTLRDGGSLEIVCDFAPDRAPAACRKAILAFPETPVIEIQSCDETPAPRTSCVRFEDWNGGLNVHLRQTGGAPEITRVHRPEPPIIMAHPRRD